MAATVPVARYSARNSSAASNGLSELATGAVTCSPSSTIVVPPVAVGWAATRRTMNAVTPTKSQMTPTSHALPLEIARSPESARSRIRTPMVWARLSAVTVKPTTPSQTTSSGTFFITSARTW